MTKELGGVILTSSLKIPETTSSKTRQGSARDKKSAVSGVEWLTLVFVLTHTLSIEMSPRARDE